MRKSSNNFRIGDRPEDDVTTGSNYPSGDVLDFVEILPPELSDKLFTFLPTKELMTCCRVSTTWRHIINNNRQWLFRCKVYDFIHGRPDHNSDPFKWSGLATHVDSAARSFKREESPVFLLPPIASARIEGLCVWGRFFRECLHLKRNWREGRYVIHKMKVSVMSNFKHLCTSAHSTSKLLAIGSNSGSVYVWSIVGVPKLRDTIFCEVDVEQVQLSYYNLAVLYQDGIVRVYKIPDGYPANKTAKLDLVLQLRVWGLPTPNTPNEYTLFWQGVLETLSRIPSETKAEQETEPKTSTPEPSLPEPWSETEYLAADMTLLMTDEHLIISGYACNCFLIFELKTKELLKKIQLPQRVQLCRKAIISPNSLFLTAKKLRTNQRFDPTMSIFSYDLQEPFEFKEFRTQDLTEEIRMDPNNPGKLVWIAQDSIIYAADLSKQKTIFVRSSEAYVDSLVVHGDSIMYHQYDGFITVLNWTGEVTHVMEAPTGISRGFECFGDVLVTGGDGRQLNVYDIRVGKLLHKILHRPMRIEYLFLHDTKIICIAKGEPAVLIGYW